ncbi:hypothetical protein ACIKT0_14630, partial [Hansschlegelia beijingensis]
REARARGERDEPTLDEPAPSPAPTAQQAETETKAEAVVAAEPAVEPEAPTAGPRLVREGELKGVTYRFFDDGSVEAESPHGRRRFASVDDLRRTVLAARGGVFDPADEPEEEDEPAPPAASAEHDRPRFGGEPQEAPPVTVSPADRVSEDPLDAALAELEQGAPPVRR